MIGEAACSSAAAALRSLLEHQGHRIRKMFVREIISSPLIWVDTRADTGTVAQLLLARSISAVLVVENGRIAGGHNGRLIICPLTQGRRRTASG